MFREKEVKRGHSRHAIDGLNSLKYHVLEIEKKKTFTRILVNFNPEEACQMKTTKIVMKRRN